MNNVTKDYKQITEDEVHTINLEAKQIATEIGIADRVEVYGKSEAFVTLKDHKEDYKTNPKCRLINPAKSQIGYISKQILQETNAKLRTSANLNQWQSTKAVLDWFDSINIKSRKKFLQLDIVEYYPSITEALLDKAIEFAKKQKAPLSSQEVRIIKQARDSLLYNCPSNLPNSVPLAWQKQDGAFDVTMGAPDGAEICEIIGLLILKELKTNFKRLDFGLYRYDGLAVHSNRLEGRDLEQTKQQLHKLFATFGLKITIAASSDEVNFLDVNLNLKTGKFKPYRKPNDTPLYVHVDSNHPASVIKQIPIGINKRLSSISSTEQEFNEAKEVYQKALNESGDNYTLAYEKPKAKVQAKDKKDKVKKKRKIIWYNPPYNEAVETNLGKQFLKLISKHFPKSNPLHSLLNRNTVKLSYSCTKNIKATIQSHNKKIMQPKMTTSVDRTCDCTKNKRHQCPLKGECIQTDVIYHVETPEVPPKKYIGCAGNFKKRYGSHTSSFRHERYQTSTTLSHHLWDKNLNEDPDLVWSIIDKAPSYKIGNRYCDLCLTEKTHILRNIHDPDYLNKRTELAQRCRHKAKFRLNSLKPP